jgi:Protein of unknown function (DUF4238)
MGAFDGTRRAVRGSEIRYGRRGRVGRSDELTGKPPLPNQPRNHHYVPQFYMRRFASPDGMLWVYDRAWKTFRRKSPKAICFETDLYTMTAYNGRPADASIESSYLAGIDEMGATILRMEFDQQRKFNGSAVRAFSFYMALQWTRLPEFRKVITAMHQITGDEVLRIGFRDPERIREIMSEYPEIQADAAEHGVTPESMAAAVKEERFTLSVSETPFLEALISQAEFIRRIMSAVSWEVLIAPNSTGFVSSDGPIVLVPPKEYQPKPFDNGIGFMIPGCVKYFPLGRRMCLRMGDQGYGFRYRAATGSTPYRG